MSRPRLDPESITVVVRYRAPTCLAEAFAKHCRELGYTVSDRLRALVERDLRALAGIRRLKKGSK